MNKALFGIMPAVVVPVSDALTADIYTEDAVGSEAQGYMSNLSNDIAVADAALTRLMDMSEIVDTCAITTPETAKLARTIIANDLTLFNDVDVAISTTAGLESEGADVGLQAFTTLREYATKIITWIQKKFNELVAWSKKFFSKFFGGVERLKEDWVKILTNAKERTENYEAGDVKSISLTKGSDAFYRDTKVVSVADLSSGVSEYKALIDLLVLKVLKSDVVTITPDDLINDGKVASKDAILKHSGISDFMAPLVAIAKSTIDKKAPSKYHSAPSKCSEPLLGRVALYVTTPEDSSSALEAIRDINTDIDTIVADQKVFDEVVLPVATPSEVETIADTNIEMLDAIINLQQAKVFDKIADNLSKAAKALDVWKKEDKETATAEERTAYRDGIRIATASFTTTRQILITMPQEVVRRAKYVSTMQRVHASKSLATYKKTASTPTSA